MTLNDRMSQHESMSPVIKSDYNHQQCP